jgi:hypothetical protein
VLVAASLASLLVVGCKQDIGDRCEQATDCNSGYCTGNGAAEPGVCAPGPTVGTISDASTSFDTGATPDTATSDARDGAAEAAEASDGHAEAGEVSSDGAAAETHSEAGASETGGDATPSTSDGAIDLATEAGAGG